MEKRVGNYIVRSHIIIGTNTEIFEAWEPSKLSGNHGTVTFIGGKVYGRIGTDPKNAEIKYEEYKDQRIETVERAYLKRHEKALAIIYSAYPELGAQEITEEKYGRVIRRNV